MNIWKLSFNLLRRDWRAGEWRVLLLALVLAVGSLATVGLFADRVRQALQQEAQSLIGADLRITSTRPLPERYRQQAQQAGLQAVMSLTFPSMVSTREQSLLSEIQAVEPGYPLRGQIEVEDRHTHVAQGIPAPGRVWADQRLLRKLDLHLGDSVSIGARDFVIAAAVVKDIDQSLGFSTLAPRVLMNAADLPGTGLLQEGSRMSYRLMIAGQPKRVATLRKALQRQLGNNEKMEDVRDARPEIRTALERAEHFLGLAALTAAILAGAAIALAARRFVARHLDACAVMRCLGAQQNQVLALFLYQLLFVGLAAVLLGSVLGYATQAVLVSMIESLRTASLPLPGVLPAIKAMLSGFALLLGFAFVPLLQLRRVTPLRVLRRELGAPEPSALMMYGVSVLVLAGLFLWHAGSLKLGLAVLVGLLAGLAVFASLAWLVLHALARRAGRWQMLRHALHNLTRHGRSAAIQVVALSLGGMALLVLTLVRADLLESWQGRLPDDAPNRFLVNIQPDQQQALQAFFMQHGLAAPQLQPMVRGRLVAINDRAINGDSYSEPRARALVEREFNLSYMQDMPSWNETVSGIWWKSGMAGQLSLEEGIAKTLAIHLGDTLTYDVAGSTFTARVTHLRKVQWDSMKVNFFVIATPELLQDFPLSYITSFYLPPAKVLAGDQLARAFPNLLVIDTGALIAQVRGIMDQISQTMSVVFLFTLFSGLAVLYAALLATQDERMFEAAILRTLGADSRYLRRLHMSEFAVLGALSGLFAAAGAELLGWVLAHFVLEISWHGNALVWLFGLAGGAALVMASGWLAIRGIIKLPPLRILAAD